ncbi:MAG: cytidine deaminase [Actinomycetota bacterium]
MNSPELDPEDQKILTLAVAARTRAYAPYTGTTQGAAVRDVDGRTYAAATVEHAEKPLTLSALHAAVAAAVASGAREFEAVAVVGERWTTAPTVDGAVLMEFGPDTIVLLGADDGTLVRRTTAAGLAGVT